jgi:hypothetical protein
MKSKTNDEAYCSQGGGVKATGGAIHKGGKEKPDKKRCTGFNPVWAVFILVLSLICFGAQAAIAGGGEVDKSTIYISDPAFICVGNKVKIIQYKEIGPDSTAKRRVSRTVRPGGNVVAVNLFQDRDAGAAEYVEVFRDGDRIRYDFHIVPSWLKNKENDSAQSPDIKKPKYKKSEPTRSVMGPPGLVAATEGLWDVSLRPWSSTLWDIDQQRR